MSVGVCLTERERECVYVCERERVHECVREIKIESLFESERKRNVCARERKNSE